MLGGFILVKNELSREIVNIIKNSDALRGSNTDKIAKRMYEILFEKFPDTKHLFENAPSNQYMLLSDTISAYVMNIDKVEKIMPALEKIAKHHFKANVMPKDYSLVGTAFISAIEEVLADKVTPEYIDAWREAYMYIANILIDMEADLYEGI